MHPDWYYVRERTAPLVAGDAQGAVCARGGNNNNNALDTRQEQENQKARVGTL